MTAVGAIFADAIVQLARRGLITMRAGLDPLEWLAFALLLVAFVYGEGLRALARRWVPAMLARARTLGPASPRLHELLAPLYAMSLIGADARTLVRAWTGVALIVLAVFAVRALPEPWRGIVDAAVAAALLVGLWAIVRGALVRPRAGR